MRHRLTDVDAVRNYTAIEIDT